MYNTFILQKGFIQMNTTIATFLSLMLLVPIITIPQETLTPQKIKTILVSYNKFQGLPISLNELQSFPISESMCRTIENNIILFKKISTPDANVKSNDQPGNNDQQSNVAFYLLEFKKNLHLFFSEKFREIYKNNTMTLKEKKYHQTVLSISFLVTFHGIKYLSDRYNPFPSKL